MFTVDIKVTIELNYVNSIVDKKLTIIFKRESKMKTVIEYLDDLKEKTGSDYMSAKRLEITKESVSKIRKRGQMADETAVKMAKLLSINEGEILLAAAIARSKGPVKEAWVKVSKRVGLTISITLATMIITSFPEITEGLGDKLSIIYIMRNF